MFNTNIENNIRRVLYSYSEAISLTKDKKEKIKSLCKQLLTPHKICKRELASVISNTVTSFTAVPYVLLYSRDLENNKLETIKLSKLIVIHI